MAKNNSGLVVKYGRLTWNLEETPRVLQPSKTTRRTKGGVQDHRFISSSKTKSKTKVKGELQNNIIFKRWRSYIYSLSSKGFKMTIFSQTIFQSLHAFSIAKTGKITTGRITTYLEKKVQNEHFQTIFQSLPLA
uniref:Uncharacterized protein n=1 Tax=Cacopsylla melanoneura TaxID=428564 RepID=A0A8D9B7A9_9HEMI